MHNTFYFVAPVRYPQAVSLMPLPLSLYLKWLLRAAQQQPVDVQPLCSEGSAILS
jgi:hypothetical protein